METLRIAVIALRTNKLRSFLTLLGIIIGVTTIVGVAGVISGLEAYVQERVIRLSPDVVVLTKFGIIRGREEFPRLERWQTDYLPVYAAWAAVVVIVFPLVFGFM